MQACFQGEHEPNGTAHFVRSSSAFTGYLVCVMPPRREVALQWAAPEQPKNTEQLTANKLSTCNVPATKLRTSYNILSHLIPPTNLTMSLLPLL